LSSAIPVYQPDGVQEAARCHRQQSRLQPNQIGRCGDGSHQPAAPHGQSREVFIDRWQAAGLLKPSVIKPVFATIEHRLVIRRLGTLSTSDQAALKQAIAEILS